MDINYDWRGYQSVFYPVKRLSQKQYPIFLIQSAGQLDQAFSRTEDWTDWRGKSVEQIQSLGAHRRFLPLDRAVCQQLLTEVCGSGERFAAQTEQLRAQARARLGWDSGKDEAKNFLIAAMQTWWKKFLPKRFAFLIQIEGTQERSERFLLAFQNNSIQGMAEPDLTHVGIERLSHDRGVVESVNERFAYPVVAFFVPLDRWLEWCQDPSPWWPFLKAMLAGEVRFRTSGLPQFVSRLLMTGLVSARVLFGV